MSQQIGPKEKALREMRERAAAERTRQAPPAAEQPDPEAPKPARRKGRKAAS